MINILSFSVLSASISLEKSLGSISFKCKTQWLTSLDFVMLPILLLNFILFV